MNAVFEAAVGLVLRWAPLPTTTSKSREGSWRNAVNETSGAARRLEAGCEAAHERVASSTASGAVLSAEADCGAARERDVSSEASGAVLSAEADCGAARERDASSEASGAVLSTEADCGVAGGRDAAGVFARKRRSADMSVPAKTAVATAGGVATERGAAAAAVARERLRAWASARDESASGVGTLSGETGAEGSEHREARVRDSLSGTINRDVGS